jgi:hypothetical protein
MHSRMKRSALSRGGRLVSIMNDNLASLGLAIRWDSNYDPDLTVRKFALKRTAGSGSVLGRGSAPGGCSGANAVVSVSLGRPSDFGPRFFMSCWMEHPCDSV